MRLLLLCWNELQPKGKEKKTEERMEKKSHLCLSFDVLFYENSKWKRFKIVKIFNIVYLNVVLVRKLKLQCTKHKTERVRVRIPIRSSFIPGEYHQDSSWIQISGAAVAARIHICMQSLLVSRTVRITTDQTAPYTQLFSLEKQSSKRKRSVVVVQALVNSINSSSSDSYSGTAIP